MLKNNFIPILKKLEENKNQLGFPSCSMLRVLPDFKYHVDKMTSTPEMWEINKNKYPDWEKNVDFQVYSEHVNKCSNVLLGLHTAINSSLKKSLVLNLRSLKQELFECGVYDPYAFQEVVLMIDASLALLHFGYDLESVKPQIAEIVFKLGSVIGTNKETSVGDDVTSSFELGEEYDEYDDEEDDVVAPRGVFEQAINDVRATSSQATINNNDNNSNITFKDIGGQDLVIEELSKKVLYPILFPKGFPNRKSGTGIVLHGPSGTGKTMLAMALANEAKIPFYNVDCTQLLGQYVGTSEANLRKIFVKAMKTQPCILFFDEIDSIARKRTGDSAGRHDDKLVNQFLTMLNGLANNKDLYIIAATNRLDILDNAILRGRRLGTHIEVAPPNTKEAVTQIMDLYLKNLPISTDFSKDKFAQKLLALKATGATIADVVDEAYEQAYERVGIYDKMSKRQFKSKDLEKLRVNNEDFEKALVKYNNGTLQTRKPIGFNK